MQKKAIDDRIFNCLPSKDIQNDWNIENARESGVLTASIVPPSKDLREDWWGIGDQGATGSCVGWATADSVLRWHFVKSGQITQNDLLSVRFIWMAAKETDEFILTPTTFIERDGTSLKAALDIARKYGEVRDSVLSLKTNQLYQGDTKTFYAIAAQLKITSYFNLGLNPDDWREWLANHGPILIRLDVDKTWMNAKTTNGVLDVYQSNTNRLGHAVTIVGYTPDYFIIRNSWGTKLWGDKGFGFASIAYTRKAFTEAYGITV
jgi:Papain family cysteine protease